MLHFLQRLYSLLSLGFKHERYSRHTCQSCLQQKDSHQSMITITVAKPATTIGITSSICHLSKTLGEARAVSRRTPPLNVTSKGRRYKPTLHPKTASCKIFLAIIKAVV